MLRGLCQAFCFVLSSPAAKCNIWLNFLLHCGLLMKQTLKIIILPSSNFLVWQAHLFGILGYCKGLFFVSLVLIIHEKLHILICCHLKVQLNISESRRTFEDTPLLFFCCCFYCSWVEGFFWWLFLFLLPAKANVMFHLGDASCPLWMQTMRQWSCMATLKECVKYKLHILQVPLLGESIHSEDI